MPSRAAQRAIGAVERAHRSFSIEALKKLHPELQGPDLARAAGREAFRDEAYLANMRSRLTAGDQAAAALPRHERSKRLASTVAAEHRYLAQHIEAAGWRMSSEADIARLKAAGEPGAVWVMDPTKRGHTEDCRRMHGKFWGWDVLDQVNPANRHAGCGCKLRSGADATAAGVTWKPGRRHAAIKREMAVSSITEARRPKLKASGFTTYVPRFGAREWHPDLHPRGARGRFIEVFGNLHASVDSIPEPPKGRSASAKKMAKERAEAERIRDELQVELDHYRDAVSAGHHDGILKHYDRMLKLAHSLKAPPVKGKPGQDGKKGTGDHAVPGLVDHKLGQQRNKEDVIQTIHRIHAAVVNPHGIKYAPGAKVPVGPRDNQHRYAVPVAPASEGIEDPWTKGRSFGWHVDAVEARDAASVPGIFTVTDTPEGHFMEINPSVPLPEARAIARDMEIRRPDRRVRRASAPGAMLNDLRPLNVGDDEGYDPNIGETLTRHGEEILGNITDRQIGMAAELSAADVYAALRRLGIADQGKVDPDGKDLVLPSAHDADAPGNADHAPLDIYMDGLAIESKSVSIRDRTLGMTFITPAIGAWQAERKRLAAFLGMDVQDPGGHNPRELGPNARRVFDAYKGKVKLRGGAKAKGLRPASLVQVVDTDNDVVHVFFHEFPDEDTAFRSIPRVPAEMTDRLARGELVPGETMAPEGGPNRGDLERGTTFVGTFPLRYNPARQGNVAVLPGAKEQARLLALADAEDKDTTPGSRLVRRGRGARAGQGRAKKSEGAGRMVDADGNPETMEQRLARLQPILRRMAHDVPQGEIGKQLAIDGHTIDGRGQPVELSQATISRYMNRLGIKKGKGTRTDRVSKKQRGADIQHRGSEVA